jgi:rubrerythrin
MTIDELCADANWRGMTAVANLWGIGDGETIWACSNCGELRNDPDGPCQNCGFGSEDSDD